MRKTLRSAVECSVKETVGGGWAGLRLLMSLVFLTHSVTANREGPPATPPSPPHAGGGFLRGPGIPYLLGSPSFRL